MTFSPTPRTDFLDGLAAEITHNYGRGRRVVAVDGATGTKPFADDLGEALERSGHPVIRTSSVDFLASGPRWDEAPADVVQVVDGPLLQKPEVAGFANFVVYLEPDLAGVGADVRAADDAYVAAVQPRMKSDAIVSTFDEANPKRLFADRC